MPSADEIQRIAATMNALRPDWRTDSLVTFLTRNHATRAYRDLAIAATVVATDPRTTTPQLLNQHGAWWVAAQIASSGPVDPIRFDRCPEIGHTSFAAWNCSACAADRKAKSAEDTAPAPQTNDMYARGARLARAALTQHAPIEPTPQHSPIEQEQS